MISRTARIGIALAAVLAALAIADYLAWLANHRRLVALAHSSGLTARSPAIVGELEGETVPTRATARLAGTLLEVETDRGWLSELDEDERAAESVRGVERLRLAASLAEELVRRRPASWRAAMVLGASRFLASSRQRRWDEPHASWRRPLAAAMRLAPSQPEPSLLLAGAELSRWSALSPGEREQALPVLRRAFEEEQSMALLLPIWVRLAPSLGTLFETIPDTAPHWERLATEFWKLGDVERYALARTRWRERLPEALDERIRQARTRLRGGDRRYARGLAEAVFAAVPELSLGECFSAALELLAGETYSGRSAEQLRRWLDWALDLCALDRCPLEPAALRRLAAAIPDLEPADLARASLAAGEDREPPQAAADGEEAPAWNRYWILRATRRAAEDPEAARRALERAAPREPDRLLYWRARAALASASDDEPALTQARAERAALPGTSWPTAAWYARGTVLRLDIEVTEPASGLRLVIDTPRPPGAALELRFDGRARGIRPFTGPGPQSWVFPVDPGLHLVEIEDLIGHTPTPLGLSLLPARPTG